MQTECPHCHTVFRVNEQELEQADSQVRCGHCLAIFTADNPYNTPTYEDVADLNTRTVDIVDNSDTASKKHSVADVIPPELRAETRSKKPGSGFIGNLFLSLAILASIAAGVLQYAYYNRDSLVKITKIRPYLQQACELAKCTLPPPKDISQLLLSSKNIFTHPNIENALMVSATIVNQADFAQDFPIIELRFENVRGKTIAARRFYAEEYLGIPKEQISQLKPETPVNINLEIRDPGSDMVSYEFTFL